MKYVKLFDGFLNENSNTNKYQMSKNFQISDEESSKIGNYKEMGKEYEDEEFDSLWDVAKEIRDAGATEISDSGKPNKNSWYSTPDGDKNPRTGEETFFSFHPKLKTDAEAEELQSLIKMNKKDFNDKDPAFNENSNESELNESTGGYLNGLFNNLIEVAEKLEGLHIDKKTVKELTASVEKLRAEFKKKLKPAGLSGW